MKVVKCDICGATIHTNRPGTYEYKIKMKSKENLFNTMLWKKYDLCFNCQKTIHGLCTGDKHIVPLCTNGNVAQDR